MIAPMWSDVDIRWLSNNTCDGPEFVRPSLPPCHNPLNNGVWWNLEAATATTPARIVVTWHEVQAYARDCATNHNQKNSFQMVLSAPTGCGAASGDFDVEFRYNRCDWNVGGATGVGPQAGFSAGNAMHNYVEIMGSRGSAFAQTLCSGSNTMPTQTGVWRFPIRGGDVQCPNSGGECNVSGQQGLCAQGINSCQADGIYCKQLYTASPEACDAVDNDCNGMTDEGAAICPSGFVCDRGSCVRSCSEGFCSDNSVCNATSGYCVEPGCESVTCPNGTRCSGGNCVDLCSGITCPNGQLCRGGRCADLCEGVQCNECTVCRGGSCVAKCTSTGCPLTETCDAVTGRCIDRRCVGLSCTDGTECRTDRCVDRCQGVRCPRGQACNAGQCVASSVLPDGGVVVIDSGTSDGSTGTVDGGRGSRGNSGCKCDLANRSSTMPFALAGLALILSLWAVRRRAQQ